MRVTEGKKKGTKKVQIMAAAASAACCIQLLISDILELLEVFF